MCKRMLMVKQVVCTTTNADVQVGLTIILIEVGAVEVMEVGPEHRLGRSPSSTVNNQRDFLGVSRLLRAIEG